MVVQGYDQIPWVQLEHSVIFLASIRLTVNLRQWIDVVFTREMFRANVEDLASYESRLLDYWKFCHVIAARYHWGTPFKWALAAAAYLAHNASNMDSPRTLEIKTVGRHSLSLPFLLRSCCFCIPGSFSRLFQDWRLTQAIHML